MEKFILRCRLGNETCELTFSIKKLSILYAYNVYKNGRWICLIHRQSNNTYKMVSYLHPISQSDIDAIGRQLELRAANNIIAVPKTPNEVLQPVYY
ncbi:MAG: hypothetical protein JWP67_3014 [Mucilaginibacter sp.]|nr:hypothetical protein [Mucilaginibacter sp.]